MRRFSTALSDPVVLWDSFKHETLDAAEESIGEGPRTRQNFLSLETLEATDACCIADLNGNRNLRRSLVRRARTLLRGGRKPFPSSLMSAVHSVDGQIILDQCWGL